MTVNHQTITLTFDCKEMDTIYTALEELYESLNTKSNLSEYHTQLKSDIYNMIVAFGSITPMNYKLKL